MLYQPIRNSKLDKIHNFILPHEYSDIPFNSFEFIKNEADLMIAEVSEPSIGLGIELGWANVYKVPILCIYKEGSKISQSLKVVTSEFAVYSNSTDIIPIIQKFIDQTINKIN